MARMIKAVLKIGGYISRDARLDQDTLEAVRSPLLEDLPTLSHVQFAQLLREFFIYFASSVHWHSQLRMADPNSGVAAGLYAGVQSLMGHPWATTLATRILDGRLWLSPGFVSCIEWASAPAANPAAGTFYLTLAVQMTCMLHHLCITYLMVHADLVLHDPSNSAEPLVAALVRYGSIHRSLRLARSPRESLTCIVLSRDAKTVRLQLAADGRAVVIASECKAVRVGDYVLRAGGVAVAARTTNSLRLGWTRSCQAASTMEVELVPPDLPYTTTLVELQRYITARIRGTIELTVQRTRVHIGPPMGLKLLEAVGLFKPGDNIDRVGKRSLATETYSAARRHFLDSFTAVGPLGGVPGRSIHKLPCVTVTRIDGNIVTIDAYIRNVEALRFGPIKTGRCVGHTSRAFRGCASCAFKAVVAKAMETIWGCGILGWAMSARLILEIACNMPQIISSVPQGLLSPVAHAVLPTVAIRCSTRTGLPTGTYLRVLPETVEEQYMLLPMPAWHLEVLQAVLRCVEVLRARGSTSCLSGLPRELVAHIFTFYLPPMEIYATLFTGISGVSDPGVSSMIKRQSGTIAAGYHAMGMIYTGKRNDASVGI